MSASSSAVSIPEIDRRLVQPWVPVVSLALAVAGLGVSIYLTIEHFTSSTTLACPDTGALNCLKVTTSDQSKFLGIPVAVLGLLYFVAMLVVSLPALWRSPSPWLRQGRVALAAVGVLFVFYLVFAELFTLDAICLWCTAVHILAVALFAVIVIGTAYADPGDLRR
ncbi:vitamin K epoxide reductase family protein [Dactylosporangium sp. AC04546]|uniref:vitamin K epoxide reductase family protein n=1 Tax=Dactylosporangium sp. AC04546 TaxID=2862460 RepID=UPI001EE083D3|nr:vitamin K epoxide reductase family protein [Dactylosporangium sp. AC04546]WVK81971.1 vitamin K epoxide reductase family protein [Dactylosporangium sp. AC04546]